MIIPTKKTESWGDGNHIFKAVKVREWRRIVIPKEAREIFGIHPGDTLMVLGDNKRGIALVKADKFHTLAVKMLKIFEKSSKSTDQEE